MVYWMLSDAHLLQWLADCDGLASKENWLTERQIKQPDPANPVDFQVILGRDYDPCLR